MRIAALASWKLKTAKTIFSFTSRKWKAVMVCNLANTWNTALVREKRGLNLLISKFWRVPIETRILLK